MKFEYNKEKAIEERAKAIVKYEASEWDEFDEECAKHNVTPLLEDFEKMISESVSCLILISNKASELHSEDMDEMVCENKEIRSGYGKCSCPSCGHSVIKNDYLDDEELEFCGYCEEAGCDEDESHGCDEFGDDEDDGFDCDGNYGMRFADPGGRSALRAETEDNPRDCACPTCGDENVLTREDKRLHYQCNRCADRAEGYGD